MSIEKLKLAASTLLLTAIGLVTVTSVLLAYQGPANKLTKPRAGTAISETAQKDPETSPGTSKPKPTPPVNAKFISDDAVAALEELRVQAELLEIEIEHEKASIKQLTQFVNGFVSDPGPPPPNKAAREDFERTQAVSQRNVDLSRGQLFDLKTTYRENQIKLALLKREIARETKTLKETDEPLPSVTGLDRRLDRLEEKLDRIISVLPAEAKP